MKGLDVLDWVVIIAYFVILLGVAWWVIKQYRRLFFGRTEHWLVYGRCLHICFQYWIGACGGIGRQWGRG